MNIGYARVSTKDQNLDLQITALKNAGCEKIFTDEISGASQERTGLSLVFAGLRKDDTVIVWKLDRLARSVNGLIDLVKEIKDVGANFKSLTENIDTSTIQGKFFFHTMASLAEMERDLIIERTRAGLKAARERGVSIGRKKIMTDSKIINATKLFHSGTPIKEISTVLGVSVPTLYRYIRKNNVI